MIKTSCFQGKSTGLCGLTRRDKQHFQVWKSGGRMNHTDCRSPFYWKPFQSNTDHIQYENFQSGEPNCFSDKTNSTQQNCLQYWFQKGSAHKSFKWDDMECNFQQCFLCEFERWTFWIYSSMNVQNKKLLTLPYRKENFDRCSFKGFCCYCCRV